jgi:hypothetical protein
MVFCCLTIKLCDIALISEALFKIMNLQLVKSEFFIIEYNENMKVCLKRGYIDWLELLVVNELISFRDNQMQANNFKNIILHFS